MLYRKGYKIQVAKTFSLYITIKPAKNIHSEFVWLTSAGLLTILSGYASDGSSGPTIETKTSVKGAVVHDALCQLMREGHLSPRYKDEVDRIAYEVWVRSGMMKIRAKLRLRALSKFDFYVDPRNKKTLYEAP